MWGVLFFVYFPLEVFCAVQRQSGDAPSNIPISIKDDGVEEMKRGDVAMIFYITVTNVSPSKETIRLSVNGTRCCRQVAEGDQDCESMHLHGGDMGELLPKDTRNLTLIYANLELHDRVGTCDIEIRDGGGNVMRRSVQFNTKITHGDPAPRLMEQYYDPSEVQDCGADKVDHNPLDSCKPYECEVRYGGARNYFNATSGRCMPVPRCEDKEKREEPGVAYIVETNSCREMEPEMTDFTEFHEGKPSVHALAHAHGYPINVQCHNGIRDATGGRWCLCDPGWTSAPFDHATFDPDLQVYHMCTVWVGGVHHPANTTVPTPKRTHNHRVTNVVVFSMLGATFVLLCCVLCWVLYSQAKAARVNYDPEETMRLTMLQEKYDEEDTQTE